MKEQKRYCTFFLDKHLFGVETSFVQEISRNQTVTPVPLVDDSVDGLINLRGQIVTAIGLGRRLGVWSDVSRKSRMSVIIRGEDELVSLQVDKIGDVLDIDIKDGETPPETINHKTRELLECVYKLDGQLLLAIDLRQTLNLTDTDEEQSAA
jgi:purine-binding chemotaxis protein CheW